ncbi:MAG: hypothetical protein J6R85_01760 [Lentisphaeria bacterium]|nr:hypothetical protein [Lentisphaeria bacterium]
MSSSAFGFGLHSSILPENWRELKAFGIWKTEGIPEKCAPLPRRRFAGDFIDPRLAQLAPGENFRLRMDFLRMLEQSLRRAAAVRMEAVTVSCDWERLENDPRYRENWLAQMRFAAGILHGSSLKMGLRFRFSGRDDAPGYAAILGILREIPTRSILLALEVHPHESAALPDEKKLLAFCREALLLEYAYEPVIGNQLTQKLIAPGIQAASAAKIPFFFHPRRAEGELLAAEAQALQMLLPETE